MSKEYERIRQDVHKQYKEQVETLKSRIHDLTKELHNKEVELVELTRERDSLKFELSKRNQRLDSFLQIAEGLGSYGN